MNPTIPAERPIDEAALLAAFPHPLDTTAAEVAERVAASGRVLVVLDDDPTGTQSVADLPVLTRWEQADLVWALGRGAAAVYVLTNTRSLDAATAAERNREVVRSAVAAAAEVGVAVAFVSRSDSTLRGHFPLETAVIAETLAETGAPRPDGVLVVPAFPDAGRVTIGGVHYMRGEGGLTPVAETEFARDATFGYASSDLRDYVAEKTGGAIPADRVLALTLDVIRSGPDAVAVLLRRAADATPVVVDVVEESDLRVVALGLEIVEGEGRSFLYRVGPPFVRARIGQAVREPLTEAEVFAEVTPNDRGGLIVVGSHVGLTSRQLARLQRDRPGTAVAEIDVNAVIEGDREAELAKVVDAAVAALATGDVIVHTSRLLVRTDDPEASLDISRRVSAAVVEVVQRVLAAAPPRFVIAKGGITSSDVAAFGLAIRHAVVRGPMLPGIVSLWQPVDGPAEGIPYIVFAGNVGDDDSLSAVVATLSRH